MGIGATSTLDQPMTCIVPDPCVRDAATRRDSVDVLIHTYELYTHSLTHLGE